MKLFKKIVLILGIVIGILILGVGGVLWYVLRPENLTPLVQEQADKLLISQTDIEKVEPTLFSSYPFVGIEIENIHLKDNDSTLVYAKTFAATLNLSDYLFDNKLTLSNFLLEDGYVNVAIDKDKNINLSSLVKHSKNVGVQTKVTVREPSKNNPPPKLAIEDFKLKNFKADFFDASTFTKAKLSGLDLDLELDFQQPYLDVSTQLKVKSLYYATSDSVNQKASVQDFALDVKAKGDIEKSVNVATQLSLSGVEYQRNNSPLHAILGEIKMALDAKANTQRISVATLDLDLPITDLMVDNKRLAKELKLKTRLPFSLDMVDTAVEFRSAYFRFDQQQLNFSGQVAKPKAGIIQTDLKLKTNTWQLKNLLALVPKAFQSKLKGVFVRGNVDLDAHISGQLTDSIKPLVKVNLAYTKGKAKYQKNPTLRDINTHISASVNLNKGKQTHVEVHDLSAKVMRHSVQLSAKAKDVMNDPQVDAKINANIALEDLKTYMPKKLKLSLQGELSPNIRTRFTLSDVKKKRYHRIYAQGNVATKKLRVNFKDSLFVNFDKGNIAINLPTHTKASKTAKLGSIRFSTPQLALQQLPSTELETQKLDLNLTLNDILNDSVAPITQLDIALANLTAQLDTVRAQTQATRALLQINPMRRDTTTIFGVKADIANQGMQLDIHDTVRFALDKFTSISDITFDKTKKNPIEKFSPVVRMELAGGQFNLTPKLQGEIPLISYQLSPDSLQIRRANVILGKSDFNLYGTLYNLVPFIEKGDDLIGRLDFVSDYTDITEMMNIFSGMGAKKDTTQITKVKKLKDTTQRKPFIVPEGVDFELVTTIKNTNFNGNELKNIKGGLTVRNGYITLEQMGFTSKAANMQLTGIYRSEREDHLYTFFDYHLLDINIEELIKLIPQVDTIVPMLKSFKGKGEFHLAARVNLFSDYKPKMSTLRAGAAFVGKDLVLLDGKTFSTIADKLMFESETENKVDSLSVEMSVYKKEIDIFPFLIHMDDYQAVVEGRHNIDGEIDYHVSVVESPLPVRLGLDIKGTLKEMEFEVRDSKYQNLYKPDKQGLMEKQMLKMKKAMIEAHRRNVKPIEGLKTGELQ